MPIHDWTRVPAGIFHDFHQSWSIEIRNALNDGLLPEGYYAFVEQKADGREPDVIALETGRSGNGHPLTGGTMVAELPKTKKTRTLETDAENYARRANRIAIHHNYGDVVAIIEIVSPGNKDSVLAFAKFVEKAADFLRQGIHMLVIDLFPPTRRDPDGIHKAIWDEFRDEPFELPPGKPLTLVGYSAGDPLKAFIDCVAVGDPLTHMPLYITQAEHVPVPLEDTYTRSWNRLTPPVRKDLE